MSLFSDKPQPATLLASTPVRVRLVAFATAAEMIGDRQSVIELPAASTVADLLDAVEQSTPGFETLRARLAIAVDGRLAQPGDVLVDGIEVALLPPVSGGRPRGTSRLTRKPLDIDRLVTGVANPACGAVLVFSGCVRSEAEKPSVTHLTYEAYEDMAESALDRICRDIGGPETGVRIAIAHRLGNVPLGQVSVAIVTASAHRDAAYDANRRALERLKREVPIWKREHFADGSATWREEESLTVTE